jgi:hypothetical protein
MFGQAFETPARHSNVIRFFNEDSAMRMRQPRFSLIFVSANAAA